MTSTAVMAVRSKASLRVSLRQDLDGTSDNLNLVHDSASNNPPPSKRPRLHQPSSRRRKSSPDLLDTTIETTPSSSSSSSSSSASKLVPPRRSSARPRPPFALSSSSSAHTTGKASFPRPPLSPGTPRSRNLRVYHHETPASSPADYYLNGGRESPDPLDTISPAPVAPKPTPKLTPSAAATTKTTAHPRRRAHQGTEPGPRPAEPVKYQTGRLSRGTAVPPSVDSNSQSTPIPAGTASPAVPEQRRTLRSHDGGSRARSELALYFPNYEELLSLEPPKTEFLTGHTVIKLIDDLTESPIPASALSAPNAETPFGNPLAQLHKCEVIALPELSSNSNKELEELEENEDPLNEEFYFRAHRRNERQEKQLRNIERDRAQHEKQQLDRLLDELQSHDWLRVMGISGLTDQDKRLYEPKRDYFIKEISALLQKFKVWKEEEKRRKLSKDKSSSSFHSDATQPHEPSSSHTKDITTNHHQGGPGVEGSDETTAGAPLPDAQTPSESPDANDVDALAARQLLQEARSATAGKRPKASAEGRKRRSSAAAKPDSQISSHLLSPPPPPPEPDKPFTSFYSKPHLRELALSKNRKGRARFAFGHPIPELEEREFQLPYDILTDEAIASCQRKQRRMKRARKG